MPTSAFVYGLLDAVGILRLTNNLMSGERRGEEFVPRLMGRWVSFEVSGISQNNIHSNRRYPIARDKDR